MSFADFLMEVLVERGWTQEELSARAQIPPSTVNAFFTRDTTPGVENLRRISTGTGISLRRLLIAAEYLSDADFQNRRLTDDEESLLLWFRRLPANRRGLVLAMLESGIRSLERQAKTLPTQDGAEAQGSG